VRLNKGADADAPGFTVCSQPSGDVCTVGDLLTSQSDELVAAAKVRNSASAGEKITLTATVRASKATSFHADATIDVVAPSSTSGSTSTSDNAGDSLPGTSASMPPDSALTSPVDSNPAGLFPTVSPGPRAGTKGKAGKDPAADATTVSSILPLNSRLIGGQLAGLAVLAAAIAIAITRLSLRTERPHDGGGSAK
jgi:hypothetical protein